MDAFFVRCHDFAFPYPLRTWCCSTTENTSYLMTYDGVKFRLHNFLKHQLVKEIDYMNHEGISDAIAIYHPFYPSTAIYLVVKQKRTLFAFDDTLTLIPSMEIDTSLVIVCMVWSQKRNTLYIVGNFGWMRALELTVRNSVYGTVAKWNPVWTKHENGHWMQHITIDEQRGILFGVSGTDVYLWSMDDGQLMLKFDSRHTMAISQIRYCEKHFVFFTASADGTIKTWRFFDRRPIDLHTIKQTPLGPMMLAIDGNTLICMSHERILRRYNTMTGNLLGSLDLDSTTPLESKNVEIPLSMELAFTGTEMQSREWILTSEENRISLFEVHYAPRELGIGCDLVKDLAVDRNGMIYALCRNNIMHTLSTSGREGKTYDLDTMKLAGSDEERDTPSSITTMRMCKDRIYFGFERGDIRFLMLKTGELFEMREPDRDHRIIWICPCRNILTMRHSHCQKTDKVEELVFSCTENCGFQIHCPYCCSFVASWKLQNEKMLKIEQVPHQKMLVVLDESHLSLYVPAETMLKRVAEQVLDEYEVAQTFAFATDRHVIVGMKSGAGFVYEIDASEKKFKLLHSIVIHNSPFAKILPCRDIARMEACRNLVKDADLEGIVCSIAEDDSLRIVDCFTGLIQYRASMPVHKDCSSAAFCFNAKLMLTLSIDRNIRLFDWPSFERLEPSPEPSSREQVSEEPKEVVTQKPAEEEEAQEPVAEEQENEHLKAIDNMPKPSIFDVKVASSEWVPPLSEEYKEFYKTCLSNPNRTPVELVMENHFPKLRFQGQEKPAERPIVDFDTSFRFGDLVKKPEQPLDETLERNRQLIEKIMLEDPDMARILKTGKVRRLRELREDEIEEEEFYRHFLAIDVKPLGWSRPSSKATSQAPERRRRFYGQTERITKIGSRREKQRKYKTYLAIETETGEKIIVSKLTAKILRELARATVAQNDSGELSPGWIFQKAMIDLDKAAKPKKKLIVREQETMVLPIMTLTDSGLWVGANRPRDLINQTGTKSKRRNIFDDITVPVTKTYHRTPISKQRYLHWEGVLFDLQAQRPKTGIVGYSTEEIEYSDEYEEDEDGVKRRHRRRKRKNSEETYEEFDPLNNGLPGTGSPVTTSFNLFEQNDPRVQAMVCASPSLKAMADMIGGSENPILELLQNSPAYTPEQIREQLDQQRFQSLAQWHGDGESPLGGNRFNIEGLPSAGLASLKDRPGSPRPMDALVELTKRMQMNDLSSLPVIMEDIPEGTTPGWDEINEGDSDAGMFAYRAQQRMRNQTIVQERLNRNDFKALRDLLEDVGLFSEDYGLADLPKWQPTFSFIPHHQKGAKGTRAIMKGYARDDLMYDEEEEECFEEEQEHEAEEEATGEAESTHQEEPGTENATAEMNSEQSETQDKVRPNRPGEPRPAGSRGSRPGQRQRTRNEDNVNPQTSHHSLIPELPPVPANQLVRALSDTDITSHHHFDVTPRQTLSEGDLETIMSPDYYQGGNGNVDYSDSYSYDQERDEQDMEGDWEKRPQRPIFGRHSRRRREEGQDYYDDVGSRPGDASEGDNDHYRSPSRRIEGRHGSRRHGRRPGQSNQGTGATKGAPTNENDYDYSDSESQGNEDGTGTQRPSHGGRRHHHHGSVRPIEAIHPRRRGKMDYRTYLLKKMAGKKKEELFIGDARPKVDMKRTKYKSVEGQSSYHGGPKLTAPHVKGRHGRKKYGEMLPDDLEFEHKKIKDQRQSGMVVEGRHKSGYGKRQRRSKDPIVDQRRKRSRQSRHRHRSKEAGEIVLESEGKSIEEMYAELMGKIKIDPSQVPTSPRALKEWMEYVVAHRNEFPRLDESDSSYSEEEEEEEDAHEEANEDSKPGDNLGPRLRITGHQKIVLPKKKLDDEGPKKTTARGAKKTKRRPKKPDGEIVLSSRDEGKNQGDDQALDSSRAGQPLHRIRGRVNPQYRRTLGRKRDQQNDDRVEEESAGEYEEEVETIEGMPEITEVEEGDPSKGKRVRRRRKRRVSESEEETKPNHLIRDDEDDEAELLERLMQQTTDAFEMNNYDDLGALEKPRLFRSESSLQKRPTALGRKFDYTRARDRPKWLPRYRVFMFDGEKLRIRNRAISVESKKRPYIPRKKLYTLSRTDIGETPIMMLTYKSPTLWDYTKGKMRRNSFS